MLTASIIHAPAGYVQLNQTQANFVTVPNRDVTLDFYRRSCVGTWREAERNAWDRKMHDVGRVKSMLAAAGQVLQVNLRAKRAATAGTFLLVLLPLLLQARDIGGGLCVTFLCAGARCTVCHLTAPCTPPKNLHVLHAALNKLQAYVV